MQYRKCIALFAAVLVGFGVIAADAQSNVSSVTISSPDSGAVRGIDSSFVAVAVVEDFTTETSDGILFYLFVGNDSTVVADTKPPGGIPLPWTGLTDATGDSTDTALNGTELDNLVRTATGAVAVKNTAGATVTNGNFVAAAITRADSAHLHAGDGDSISVSKSGNNITYTWHGRVSHTSGTVSGIRVAASAWDATGSTMSAATKLSPATLTFGIDGDRPVRPADMVSDSSTVAGERATQINTYSAFTSRVARGQVLGIGDTIKVDVKLGSQATVVLTGTSTLALQANVFGKMIDVSKTASNDTINFRKIIAAGDFGDLVGADVANNRTDTVAVYIVDAAGNLSGGNNYYHSPSATRDLVEGDQTPAGVSVPVRFFVDGKAPVLDGGVVAGDTILPVSTDTITDGAKNTGFSDDLNVMTVKLAERLQSLRVIFSSGPGTLDIANQDSTLTHGALDAGDNNLINFSNVGNADSNSYSIRVTGGTGTAAVYDSSKVGGTIKTGVQTISFTGTDLAGNTGATLTRTNVYVDVTELTLTRLFPTTENALDTLEQETAKVTFKMSEAADSVNITYTPSSGTARKRVLVGSELTTLTEQTFSVDSLESGKKYGLTILTADLAGNYTRTTADSFVYDTSFVVPVIASFKITASTLTPTAGDTVALTVTSRTVTDCVAVTYKEAAVLRVSGASGLTVWGTGVTTDSTTAGRFLLNADDWVTGSRTVNLRDTTAVDSLTVAVSDCTDTTKLYVGTLASKIGVSAAAIDSIVLSAGADTIGQGDATWVTVTLADKFGNATATNSFVEISTNALGVDHPTNAIQIKDGAGGFWLNSQGYSGSLTVSARRITGGSEEGNMTVVVDGNGATVVDDPDTLVGADYKGADNLGDQGGFVMLTWPASDDHATLSGYRIYREITVTTGSDGAGGLVALAEPAQANVAWASVDAVPGQTVVRAIVATLDAVESNYSVAAERGGLSSSKVAFDAATTVAASYELMAETMQSSRDAAQLDLNAPVFASLTPEALAFDETGVAPRFKVVDGVMQSNLRGTVEPVRAIDNIAPQAVEFLQAIDTPNDFGGSVTVQWAKSADDQVLTIVNPQAVGTSNVFTTAGVTGYNVYRKVNDGAFQLVGKAGSGETSYTDQTVFNGVRYTYTVSPYDMDNEAGTALENSAMAVRNNAVAADGTPVLGLFGADARVDYDDFFIFADHFGLSAGAEAYEPAFDLSPNNQIDYDDFFVFADNFGKAIQVAGKVVPTMAGLNSDARFYLDAGLELPRVGEDMTIAVSLEEFVEVKAYGLTVAFDAELLEFVGTNVEDNILGESELSTPQAIARGEREVYIAAFGDVASQGDLSIDLIFRAKSEIEASYIEISSGALQDGSYGLNQITTPASVRIETRPDVYALQNNYPNPFNPETTIKYQLPEAGEVTLEIYNMLGQVVNTLVNDYQTAGRYVIQWDATNNNGQSLSSGVYFYRISAGEEFHSIKKMLLLK